MRHFAYACSCVLRQARDRPVQSHNEPRSSYAANLTSRRPCGPTTLRAVPRKPDTAIAATHDAFARGRRRADRSGTRGGSAVGKLGDDGDVLAGRPGDRRARAARRAARRIRRGRAEAARGYADRSLRTRVLEAEPRTDARLLSRVAKNADDVCAFPGPVATAALVPPRARQTPPRRRYLRRGRAEGSTRPRVSGPQGRVLGVGPRRSARPSPRALPPGARGRLSPSWDVSGASALAMRGTGSTCSSSTGPSAASSSSI